MDVLLTDKELDEIIAFGLISWVQFSVEKDNPWERHKALCNSAVRAQLKKVVEWLEDGVGEWHDVPETGGKCFCIYELCWQELKRMVDGKG